jgi:autotransporter adhesin
MNAEANMTFDGSTLAITGAITATGDITAFQTSDKNLKENIVNINNSLDKVSKLNGVYYNWTKEALEKNKHLEDVKEVGVIAQDVEEVLPEIVATRENGTKAVKYERLCALLIESVKELKKEIEELKSGA